MSPRGGSQPADFVLFTNVTRRLSCAFSSTTLHPPISPVGRQTPPIATEQPGIVLPLCFTCTCCADFVDLCPLFFFCRESQISFNFILFYFFFRSDEWQTSRKLHILALCLRPAFTKSFASCSHCCLAGPSAHSEGRPKKQNKTHRSPRMVQTGPRLGLLVPFFYITKGANRKGQCSQRK